MITFEEFKEFRKGMVATLLQPDAKKFEEQIPCSSHRIKFEMIDKDLIVNLIYSDEKEYCEIMDNKVTSEVIKRLLKLQCTLALEEIKPMLTIYDEIPTNIKINIECSYEPSKYSCDL